MPVVTWATAWTCAQSGEKCILIFNETLCIGEKLDNTLVNPNTMSHHRIDVQDNPWMEKSMGIPYPEEDVTVPLYMSGTFVLFWHLVKDTAKVRGLSVGSPDILTWIGSSFCSISKRLAQLGRGRFICRYCGNLRWHIAEQSSREWNIARAMQHHTRPILHCEETSVTGENCRRQSSKCNKNHWSWWGCFWRSAPRRTLL